jgi:hypothetical protein
MYLRLPAHNFLGLRRVVQGAALFVMLAYAHADAAAQVKWSFGGFGTLAAAHATTDQGDYTTNPNSPGEAGYSRKWAFDVDSRVGAQVDAQFDKRWSAVVQVTQEKSVNNSYETFLTWANVKLQVTPDIAVRAGRIALPLFLTADYRKAGYALPWLRSPVELYSLIPISNSDGIDATYRWRVGTVKNETQFLLGRANVQLNKDFKGTAKTIVAMTHNVVAGALTLRFTASQALLEVPGTEELFDSLRAFGSAGESLAARYDIAKRQVRVFSVGVNYDPGNWFLIGESGRVNTRSILGDQTASYLSAGYRFGKATPYVTYAHLAANMPTQTAGIPLDGMPPETAGVAGFLNEQLNFQLHQIGVQDTASIGMRWDLAPNMALKAQVDHVIPKAGSIGTLINVQPGFNSGQSFRVVSVGLDFVF